MARFGRLLAVGLGAVGAGVLYYSNEDTKVLYAAQRTDLQPAPTTKWDWNWDKRDPQYLVRPSEGGEDDVRFKQELESKKPTATRHLLLIRHGQYNMEGKNDRERVLTDIGIQQAKVTGDRLVTLNFPYQSMIRSTMTRAQQTGDYILTRMKPGSVAIKDDKLLEEGSPYPTEPSNGWRPEVNVFQSGSRIEAAFRNYFHRADYRQKEDSFDIIVCHANVIRYFVCRALQLPPEAWLRMSLNHASITWISIRPSGLVGLQYLGDSGHLPLELLTR
ncbi:Serine/threonine-protein phosphatase PGAM5, mitochondrial [Frankliniella fusca]|uniref:Serine/threonine-protein phosphatase PGAM5, mitochondrial n=1 Tax=Frankliniella fusca TaxID=407009 RepID=A0AAE1HTY5_9NEOP|nr:Serine/threonine-protein phosphatase PGAM5, mitochondrial [Frankliniella fusca]